MSKIKKLFKIFVLSSIIFMSYNSYSQKKIASELLEYGVILNKPKGFKLIDNDKLNYLQHFFTSLDKRKHNLLPTYYLQNRDSSVMILIESFNYLVTKPGIFYSVPVDDNKISFNHLRNHRDTISVTKIYGASELKKTNADWIAEFTRYFGTDNTFGQYKYNKSFIFNKNDQIFLEVTVLFTESSKMKMEKVAKSTKNLFQFKQKPQVPTKSIENNLEKYSTKLDQSLLQNSLQKKGNRGKMYQFQYYFWGEDFAIKKDDVIISVKYTLNNKWPYFNNFEPKKIDTTSRPEQWAIANNVFRDILVLAKKKVEKCAIEDVNKLNADEAYLFDFTHDQGDNYRGEYKDCKVLLMHKRNIGSVLVKYYYKPKDSVKADMVIKDTWGKIAFKDQSYFDSLNGVIYPY
ncbi:hypothetical protein [Sphingobacterium sp. UDSM-2020]|uniref:hypothetical protein n=1 Tax=Sphingobacterium sp. UDSM-2020 TaxID=2795738 RepID=UPI0019389845|nr:hypothetical protein [Sphingobacterium sp. UDSM-2020]QQD11929.1 hypothetical protein JAZ75_14985 [Sphingobacterium sp. UDSM-2020]